LNLRQQFCHWICSGEGRWNLRRREVDSRRRASFADDPEERNVHVLNQRSSWIWVTELDAAPRRRWKKVEWARESERRDIYVEYPFFVIVLIAEITEVGAFGWWDTLCEEVKENENSVLRVKMKWCKQT